MCYWQIDALQINEKITIRPHSTPLPLLDRALHTQPGRKSLLAVGLLINLWPSLLHSESFKIVVLGRVWKFIIIASRRAGWPGWWVFGTGDKWSSKRTRVSCRKIKFAGKRRFRRRL